MSVITEKYPLITEPNPKRPELLTRTYDNTVPQIVETALLAVNNELESHDDQLATLVSAYCAIRQPIDRFKTADNNERRETRLKYKQLFAAPLYELAKQCIHSGASLNGFLDSIVKAYQYGEHGKATGEFRDVCRSAIIQEFATEFYKQILDLARIKHREPLEDEIKTGADIVINKIPISVATNEPTLLKKEGAVTAINIPLSARDIPRLMPALLAKKNTIIATTRKFVDASKKSREHAFLFLRKQKMARKSNNVVRASLPGHSVLLAGKNAETRYGHPEDKKSTRAEMLAMQIISSASDDKLEFSPENMGDWIINSIDTKNDDELLIALKRLAGKLCDSQQISVINGLNNINLKSIVHHSEGRLRVSELRDFMTYVYELSHRDYRQSLKTSSMVMDKLSGFRVEASVAKMARAAGFTVREATDKEDAAGADLFIDGVPFDIKSSELASDISALEEKDKHKRHLARHSSIKLVPPITAKDFAGNLIISDETANRLVALTPFVDMINKAIAEYYSAEPVVQYEQLGDQE